MTGRPSNYTAELADAICGAIIEGAEGGALYKLCESRSDFPAERTVYQWLDQFPDFAQKYARARELQQDRAADEIITIADEAKDANIARLRIDARKWRASKLAPKKYGDKLDLNVNGKLDRFTDDQLDDRITQLLGQGATPRLTGGKGT